AAEAIKLMASAKPELLSTSEGLSAATKSALTLAQAAGTTLPDTWNTFFYRGFSVPRGVL
ncbi:hypothetical protein DSB74_27025, partial [Salmonella enterica subsp. enterica serovar Typhimurium]|uniref:hypothetical protein n=1 Tax=Salmonella enterica TaxID=28901 RepID=UPI00115A3E6D